MSNLSAFEEFCGSVFWNSSTIYTNKPDLTPCFQNTILVWLPCVFLWLLSPTWAYMCKRKRVTTASFSWLTLIKTIVLFLLCAIEIGHIALAISRSSSDNYDVYSVYYVTPSILLISYGVTMFFILYEIKYGLRSSVLLFCFWLGLLLLSTFTFRTKIIQYNENYPNIDYWDFILFYEFYGLVLIMLILSMISEPMPKNKIHDQGDENSAVKKKPYPEPYATLLSRITFWWLNPMIISGYKKDLTREDMWDIDEHEQCNHLTKKLEHEWNKAADEYMKKVQIEQEEFERNNKGEGEFVSKIKEPSLAYCLIKIFAGKFIAGAFLKLVQDMLVFVGPNILNFLIEFTNDRSQNAIIGYFFTGLLFLSSVIQTLTVSHYFHRMFIVGARIRTALMGLIYKKSLRLSTSARKGATTGEIVNLMQVNTQTFVDLTPYLNMLWSAPLQIIVSIALLWQYLGVASLAGLATMIVFIPINIFLSNRSKVLQTDKLKLQDSRIKLTNEVLNGIKVLKLYGWELSFKNILEKIRESELGVLLKMGIYNTIISFSWGAASFLVATASFIAYILMDESNNLDASTAFVSLTLFNIIRFPLMILPQVITSLIQANVSMTRIRRFLLKDEIDESQISHDKKDDSPIIMEDVTLGWSPNEKALKNISLRVKKGELVAIVGSVGAGKSSLLSGIMGEMHKQSGYMNTQGSMAYVAQQAWIQNATLKNNILFGSELDEAKYQGILDACALRTDLNILPAGDSTEIGEKGINLSGGQKQRVSLSRAVYADADTYMLDDPLSAVDAHVGKHIFEQVLGPHGLLRNKTRVFATNNLTFLHQCDRIVYLEKGEIKEMGTYTELTKENTALSEFIGEYLKTHQKQREAEEAEENPKEKKKESKKEAIKKEKKDDDPNEKEKAGEKLVVKEKIESGQVKLTVLIEYFKSCTILFSVLFMIFYVLMNVAQSAVSIYLSDWSNNADNPDDNKYVRLGVYTALGLAQYTLMLFGDLCHLKMLMRSSRYLHSSMLYSILRSTMQFFESTPVGRLINRFSKDIEAVETTIPASYKMLLRCLFQVILTVIVISIQTPYFLIPLVPISIIYIYVQRYYIASMRQLRRLNSVSKSPIFSHFGETLTGLGTIRAYNAQGRFIREMENRIDENLIYYYPDTVSNRWLAVRLEFIGTLITLFACLFTVIGRSSDLTGGQAGLSISYSLNIAQILNWLVRMSADFESAVTSVERIKEYCETPHEASWTSDKPPSNDWPDQGQIAFNNYSVRYREELDFVLKDIDCVIKPSEKIGIVGRTGAGKSSLTLALFRILESNFGEIVIDNWDIRKMGLHDLRKKLTIIPQDPVLFSGTLRINLDPFELYSDEKIWRALENAHLKEFVMSLDKKLQFECSEGGENLSVGQRQLVCLARALLRKTKILILDEATAAVDMNTDDLIQSTIRTEFADCTVLTIAHRLNTIMDYTRVMVLDQGKIIEFDSPATLMTNKNSVFFSMASSAGLAETKQKDI